MQTGFKDKTKFRNRTTRTSYPKTKILDTNNTKNIQNQKGQHKQSSDDKNTKDIIERDVLKAKEDRKKEQVHLQEVRSHISVSSEENPNKITINVINRTSMISKQTTQKTNNDEVFVTETINDQTTKKEVLQNKCCRKVNLTSTEETQKLYPFVIGIYELSDNDRIVYKKEGQARFISRPPGLTRKGLNTFSWGVNSNPDGKWGWIKAFSGGDCPHQIDHWKAYDRTRKIWISDLSLSMQCILET